MTSTTAVVVTGATGNVGRPLVALLADAFDHPALVTHDVEKILGRPAESFAQWVSNNCQSFAN